MYFRNFSPVHPNVSHFDNEKKKDRLIILVFDICCVRMMMSITNEYRQVKVHRKRKFNQETVGKREGNK